MLLCGLVARLSLMSALASCHISSFGAKIRKSQAWVPSNNLLYRQTAYIPYLASWIEKE